MDEPYAPLLDCVVDAVVFAALSGDDVVDPDAAVTLLESIAASLQQLAPDMRASLVRRFEDRAGSAPMSQRDAIRALPQALGI